MLKLLKTLWPNHWEHTLQMIVEDAPDPVDGDVVGYYDNVVAVLQEFLEIVQPVLVTNDLELIYLESQYDLEEI